MKKTKGMLLKFEKSTAHSLHGHGPHEIKFAPRFFSFHFFTPVSFLEWSKQHHFQSPYVKLTLETQGAQPNKVWLKNPKVPKPTLQPFKLNTVLAPRAISPSRDNPVWGQGGCEQQGASISISFNFKRSIITISVRSPLPDKQLGPQLRWVMSHLPSSPKPHIPPEVLGSHLHTSYPKPGPCMKWLMFNFILFTFFQYPICT